VAGSSVNPGTAVALVISSGSPSGLVAAFGFEEAAGTTAINSATVAGAVNGTLGPAAGTAPVRTAAGGGKIGRALSFDGINDWVTVLDTATTPVTTPSSPLDLTTGMTLEAWVKPAVTAPATVQAGWDTVMMKERGAAGAGLLSYALYAHDGAPQAGGFAGPAGYLRVDPVLTTTDQGVRGAVHTALPLNVWTHIATTYDGTNMRFYINGALVGTKAQTGSITRANGPLRIGGNLSSGEFFQGLIDEVRVYNRALSAAEITTDMTTPIVP
jgi:hypothetical protein